MKCVFVSIPFLKKMNNKKVVWKCGQSTYGQGSGSTAAPDGASCTTLYKTIFSKKIARRCDVDVKPYSLDIVKGSGQDIAATVNPNIFR